MVSFLLAGISPSILAQRTRLLPRLLTRTGPLNAASDPARFPLEWWPASVGIRRPMSDGQGARIIGASSRYGWQGVIKTRCDAAEREKSLR